MARKTKVGAKLHRKHLEVKIARLKRSMAKAAEQLIKDTTDLQVMVDELAAIVAALPPVVVVDPAQPVV